MMVDWRFDSSEIVLAMSLLQMSWPFGAMIALPIQAFIAQSLRLARGDAVSARLRQRLLVAFTFASSASSRRSRRRRPRPDCPLRF